MLLLTYVHIVRMLEKERSAATFATGTIDQSYSCNMFRRSGSPPAGFNIDITSCMSSAGVETLESSILHTSISVMTEHPSFQFISINIRFLKECCRQSGFGGLWLIWGGVTFWVWGAKPPSPPLPRPLYVFRKRPY